MWNNRIDHDHDAELSVLSKLIDASTTTRLSEGIGLRMQFPATLAHSDRVLKQNRGSTGEGIWVVQPHSWKRGPGVVVDGSTKVAVTAMVDNKRQVMNVTAFMQLCCQYLAGAARGLPVSCCQCPPSQLVIQLVDPHALLSLCCSTTVRQPRIAMGIDDGPELAVCDVTK